MRKPWVFISCRTSRAFRASPTFRHDSRSFSNTKGLSGNSSAFIWRKKSNALCAWSGDVAIACMISPYVRSVGYNPHIRMSSSMFNARSASCAFAHAFIMTVKRTSSGWISFHVRMEWNSSHAFESFPAFTSPSMSTVYTTTSGSRRSSSIFRSSAKPEARSSARTCALMSVAYTFGVALMSCSRIFRNKRRARTASFLLAAPTRRDTKVPSSGSKP
mmetsp:Transcript_77976/g.216617  ORF Transcript_77976/g.216617 Transcript_77976/m.216617 type:complete len:217 (+) Transcript_77976:899-1549(+)